MGDSPLLPALAVLKHGDAASEYRSLGSGCVVAQDGAVSYLQEILQIPVKRLLVWSAGRRTACMHDGPLTIQTVAASNGARLTRLASRLASWRNAYQALARFKPSFIAVVDGGYLLPPAMAYSRRHAVPMLIAVPHQVAGRSLSARFRRWVVATAAGAETTVAVAARGQYLADELTQLGISGPGNSLRCYYPRYDESLFAQLISSHDCAVQGGDVVFLGRLADVKGVGDLPAIADMLDMRRLGRLVVIGDGPCSEWLRRALADTCRSGAALMIGALSHSEAMERLAGARMMVVPSRNEGIAKSAIEACILGIPVVAYDVGGVGRVVVDDRTGFLVPPGDLAKFLNAVERIALDAALYHRLRSEALVAGRQLVGMRPTFSEVVCECLRSV